MVRTDGFVGKRKVKDRWEDGGFVVESQLEDWPVYKVRCLTAAETLRNGYFGLFGAPAYLVSDQGKAFMGHLITNLCELYGVQKLRTLPYHAQTNGQVERMNQTIIRMIGKLEQDKKAHWSEPVSYTHLTLPTILRV